MKVLLETKVATLRYNEEYEGIELVWKEMYDSATYRTVFNKALESLTELGAANWLSDIRNQGVVGPVDSNWLQKDIIPKAIAAGLKKTAIVMDSEVFKKFYVSNIDKTSQKLGGFEMKYFGSMEEAKDWLCVMEAV